MDPRLNLAMNVRSPRAEKLNEWVDACWTWMFRGQRHVVPDPLSSLSFMTRDLGAAKAWLRDRTAVDHRCGLVPVLKHGDSGHGVWTQELLRTDKAWADWFLRLSGRRALFPSAGGAGNELRLPGAGARLGWRCWGNVSCRSKIGSDGASAASSARGWQRANEERRRYIINSYRVILTCSRLGQVIWVPKTDDARLDPAGRGPRRHLRIAAGRRSHGTLNACPPWRVQSLWLPLVVPLGVSLHRGMETKTAKQETQELLDVLRDDVTMDGIMAELHFKAKVLRGLEQAERGEVVGQDDAKKRLARWLE